VITSAAGEGKPNSASPRASKINRRTATNAGFRRRWSAYGVHWAPQHSLIRGEAVGTEISLDIGGLSVSWAKNHRDSDHGFLFQRADLQRIQSKQINYDVVEKDDPELEESERGFARSLAATVPRLELLGHTLKSAQFEYERDAATCLEERRSYREDGDEVSVDLMTFADFRQFVSAVSIADLDDTYVSGGLDEDERIMGRFSDEGLKARLPFYPNLGAQAWSERSYSGTLVGFLHPYTLLRLLAENEANLGARLEWQYGPLVFDGGYAREAEFVPGARRTQTYLITTEGSSDTHILKNAFQLLRPEIADFFRFIDVSERHPFSGIGSLVKFAEGLAKIDVQNRTVFLFDNDAEGQSAFRKVQDLSLPANMRTMFLPHLKEFESFPTIGPGGQALTDINGRAASIECYLDLEAKGSPPPLVRWTNYKEDVNTYHGALEDKERYTKVFFDNAGRGGTYNTSKLSSVLGAVVGVCTAMAEDMDADDEDE
jgi:hypothetical protein